MLTGIPVKSFQDGIIPYQHYVQYITEGLAQPAAPSRRRRAMPPPPITISPAASGCATRSIRSSASTRFVSMEEMTLVIQPNDWPTDEGLYQSVLDDRWAETSRSSTSS